MINLRTIFKEQANDLRLVVAGCIEQARLAIRVLKRHIALCFLNQPLCHMEPLIAVFDAHRAKQRVLAEVRLIDQLRNVLDVGDSKTG